MLSVVTDAQAQDELRMDLDELVREGARRMLAAALEAEVDAYLAAHVAERDGRGRRLVGRNGHARPREVLTAAGGVQVRTPRVDDWLVIVGVRADGTKELVAVADGERESAESWAELLRDLRRRGMRAPVVAVGDGGLGLWAALREVFPATRQQRDWVHKTANVLAALPKVVHAGARRALTEIRDAPDREHAEHAIEVFAGDYGVKWPKAAAKGSEDAEALLCFYDFPAEHWVHLKTSNPIESTFAPVRARTRVTKVPVPRRRGWRWRSSCWRPPRAVGGR
jgi:transposase-like protein